MQHLTALVTALATETSLRAGIDRLQRDVCRILGLRDAAVLCINWPHRIAWTLAGRIPRPQEEAVLESAGSGKRALLDGAVLEPLGSAPARAVLAFRKPANQPFEPRELAVMSTLATTIAPAFDRLVRGAGR